MAIIIGLVVIMRGLAFLLRPIESVLGCKGCGEVGSIYIPWERRDVASWAAGEGMKGVLEQRTRGAWDKNLCFALDRKYFAQNPFD